ncbi:MAG TPA: glycosyltransferase [Candidatus Polarisedimenticolaceae bacterium]|nr:glycosyltransferase [Candidatus Polarisedimenticolaceae bacterium]
MSVVIPAYNAAAFLGEALESVFAQGIPDVEVVVVDDGSSDGTAEVARRFGRGVRVLSQPRSGSGRARNLGLSETNGEIVAFLDADDVWVPDKMARQLPILEGDRALALVFSDMVAFGEPGVEGRSYFRERGFTGRCTPGTILVHDMISTPTVVLRRACLPRTGPFDTGLPIGQDTDLWIRLALHHPVAFVSAPLVRRRFHPGNATRNHRLLARCVVEIGERYLEGCIAAEPAMERELREDLARKRWHHWFLEGCAQLHEGRPRASRPFFARAIREKPLRARAYAFYLRSLLPGGAAA